MTQTLRVSSAADLLAVLPYRLGFQPIDSIVLVELDQTPMGSVRAGRRGLGTMARADIPTFTAAPQSQQSQQSQVAVGDCSVEAIADALTRWLATHDVRAVLVVVVYETSTGPTSAGSPTQTPYPSSTPAVRLSDAAAVTLQAVMSRLDTLMVDALDVLLVGSEQFTSLPTPLRNVSGIGNAEQRPTSSAPLAAITDSPVHAAAVARGLTSRPTRADLAPDLTLVPTPERSEAFAALRTSAQSPASPAAAFAQWQDVRRRLSEAQRSSPGSRMRAATGRSDAHDDP